MRTSDDISEKTNIEVLNYTRSILDNQIYLLIDRFPIGPEKITSLI